MATSSNITNVAKRVAATKRTAKKATSAKDTAKKATAVKAVAAVKKATAPKPDTTTPANPVQVPPTSNVGGNSSGTIQLQTNADIEQQVLEAETQRQQLYSDAAVAEQQGLAQYGLSNEQLRQYANSLRGSNNKAEAYRGLHGTSAVKRSAEGETGISSAKNAVEAALQKSKDESSSLKLQGDRKLSDTNAWATMARKEYTDQRSRENPTAGSTPVNSGVVATKPVGEALTPNKATPIGVPKPVVKKPVVKAPVKKPVVKKPVVKKPVVKKK